MLLSQAEDEAKAQDDFVSIEHLLLAMTDDKGAPVRFSKSSCKSRTIDECPKDVRGSPARHLAEPRGDLPVAREVRSRSTPAPGWASSIRVSAAMKRFANRAGVESTYQEQPWLIGELGVGKTAIVKGGSRIVHSDIPGRRTSRHLARHGSLIAGAKFRGNSRTSKAVLGSD